MGRRGPFLTFCRDWTTNQILSVEQLNSGGRAKVASSTGPEEHCLRNFVGLGIRVEVSIQMKITLMSVPVHGSFAGDGGILNCEQKWFDSYEY